MAKSAQIRIRQAKEADIAEIARVQANSWGTTYVGIVPDEYLSGISPLEWQNHWSGLSSPTSRTRVFVAATGQREIVGVASGGLERSNDPVYGGELYAIYLLEEYQRKGIGKRLTATIAGVLLDSDTHSMLVWVLADNLSARRFYEALGGQYVREQEIRIGGVSLVEVAYGWRDISVLVPQADRQGGRQI